MKGLEILSLKKREYSENSIELAEHTQITKQQNN
jgi:hypothetical protein